MTRGHAHGRHRQAGLPALLRGQRPDQRQGLRERRRLRDRRPARLRRGRRRVDGRAVQLLLRAGPEGLRLRRQPDLDHARSAPSRSTSPSPYYEAEQAVVALKDSDLAARDLARRPRRRQHRRPDRDHQPRRGQRGDPADRATRRSSTPPTTSSRALKNGQVDAVVVDVPTAFYLTAVQVPEATTVGQFPAPGGDEWGALLEKDSPLTDCVSAAIDELAATPASCRRSRSSG